MRFQGRYSDWVILRENRKGSEDSEEFSYKGEQRNGAIASEGSGVMEFFFNDKKNKDIW